jgi:hypothetical protein
MTTKTSRVLVIGGYGAVGREAATALTAHADVLVAGRHPERARPVPGTSSVRLDLAHDDQIAAALDGADTVLMCAENGNARVAEAALARGIGYVDISATPAVLSAIEQLHGPGTAVLSVGLAPGVTNLLSRHVSERAPGSPVRIGVLLGSGERHGTAAVEWTVDGLGQEMPAGPSSWAAAFPEPYGRRTVHAFPFADQHTLRSTLGVADVRTGLALDSRLMTGLLGAAGRPAVAGLLKRRPAIRQAAVKALGAVHVGSDGFAVTVEAGAVVASFSGRRQSRATGLFAAQVIRRLPNLPAGVHHIEQLVDPTEFLTELATDNFTLRLP